MRAIINFHLHLKIIGILLGFAIFLPVIANGKIPVHFFPHDYDGFKTASDVKAKANKKAVRNRICKARLVGLDLARSYAGAKTCVKNTQSPSGLLSNKIDYVILVDDTQKMSSYLTSLLADQKVLRPVNGRQIISPTLLEFKGRESDLKVLVVGESHFQNLTGTNTEKKWFATLDVIETHIFPALKELTNQDAPAEFGLREKPLQVSSGNRQKDLTDLYHKCTREMVVYVKQRDFGLVKIGGPVKRCISIGPPKLDSSGSYTKIEWYNLTRAEKFKTCKVRNSPQLSRFKNKEWYKSNSIRFNSALSKHALGLAADYFTKSDGNNIVPTSRELILGDKFVEWVKRNALKFHVKNIIWNKYIYKYKVESNGGLTWTRKMYYVEGNKKKGPHYNHIHVEHLASCNLP